MFLAQDSDDASGSPIEADKPIGLFGGAQCPFVPPTIGACDTLQQLGAVVCSRPVRTSSTPARHSCAHTTILVPQADVKD